MDYQWYPGHMTKARRMMQENIGLVDLVIELADARIPLSSRNPDIDSLCGNKARILLMTKADMADPVRTAKFQKYFEDKGFMVIAMDARTRKANEKIKAYVEKACAAKRERDKRRGIVGRPLRAMVVGIPNVGKSTFINSFAGKASAKTGNKPGVTRGKQWIRLNKNLELLDTPGILWPKFEDRQVGVNLALTGAIRQELLEEQELSLELLDFLQREYPALLKERYAPEGPEWEFPMDSAKLLGEIALSSKRAASRTGRELPKWSWTISETERPAGSPLRRRRKEEKPVSKEAKSILSNMLYIAGVLFLSFLIVRYVGQRTEVIGNSMVPTLQDEDQLITDKITYRFRDPERFDIIVFPHEPVNEFYIKRIIGHAAAGKKG